MITEAWRKTLLPSDATLQQAIRCLDETGLQIALVASASGSLIGTLTDAAPSMVNIILTPCAQVWRNVKRHERKSAG